MSGVTYFDTDMNGYMEPCEGGRWVRADDYDALAARLAEVEAAGVRYTTMTDKNLDRLAAKLEAAEARVREVEAGP